MKPLPEIWPVYRETNPVKAHKDFSVRFDSNANTITPWAVDKQVVVKADAETVSIYEGDILIADHRRGYERKMRIETSELLDAARLELRRLWRSREVDHFTDLAPPARHYLEKMALAGRAFGGSVKKLINFEDEYGRAALFEALKQADAHRAYGADYAERIPWQNLTTKRNHPPVRLLKNASTEFACRCRPWPNKTPWS